MSAAAGGRPLSVFLVAGEESGDRLGADLMRALRARHPGAVRFAGVGGAAMAAEGLASLFPLAEITLAGFIAVARRIPGLLARIRETAAAAVAADPDVLVIIDSPDFTHRVARRVRRAAPAIPILDYVSPSVWAWRSGRARAMRAYVDHVLALLPFEPAAHARLGGPPCTYVGHPLAAARGVLRPDAAEAARRQAAPPRVVVLPGSRRTEVARLMQPFGAALARVAAQAGPLDLVLPTLPQVAELVAAGAARWPLAPRIVVAEADKLAAFRTARAALCASGTVTLELALAGVPMVVGYRVAAIEAVVLRRLIRVPSVVLANLVLGETVVPEFLQERCTPAALAQALAPLLADTAARRRQAEAFARLDLIMESASAVPSRRAADIVLAHARGGQC